MPRRKRFSRTGHSRFLQCCEPLESRRLLSTMFLTGTAGDNNWSIQAEPGNIYVNGVLQPSGGITDIQIDGLAGNDAVVVYNTSLPIVFNAGSENDSLTMSGGFLDNITAQVARSTGRAIRNGATSSHHVSRSRGPMPETSRATRSTPSRKSGSRSSRRTRSRSVPRSPARRPRMLRPERSPELLARRDASRRPARWLR